MKQMILFIFFIILLGGIYVCGEVTVYLGPGYSTDGENVQLTLQNLTYRNFPKPKHQLPVLFVHGHNSGSGNKSFQEHWQEPLNDLPSFQQTLELPENSWLDIEPYYIDLEDYKNEEEKKNRSLEEDAYKMKEAVELILLHQGDPGADTKKVVIIAFGRGAVSARYYLKDLWEKQNRQFSFHPVSELIAISPPNHGLNSPGMIGQDCLALQQLSNGFDENCNRFPDSRSHHFIEQLNGHPIQDTMKSNYCASIFDSEAPGSRRDNEPIEKGTLYVTFYAPGNRAIVGGNEPGDDCQGRVLAKNLAPNAENREVSGVPGGDDALAVHHHTVHMPEVICKALYTAVYHQAPPDELACKNIIPPLQPSQQEVGIVLLFDISQSMSQSLPLVQKAVAPFMKLVDEYWNRKANVGIAIFPALPWSCQPQKEGCTQTINPMTLVTGTNNLHTIKTINCLTAQGYTPLLKGIETALEMLGTEKHKAIILVSDGHHNFPTRVNSDDVVVDACLKNLEEKQVVLYAVGIDGNIGVNHKLLGRLAENRTEHLKGNFFHIIDPGFNANTGGPGARGVQAWDLETALSQAYKSIFTDFLDRVKKKVTMDSPLKMKTAFDKDTYETGEIITFTAAISRQGVPLTGLTDVTVTVTRPVEGLGNWYALNKVSSGELATIAETIADESMSALQRKTLFLAQNRSAVLPVLRQRTPPLKLQLYDDGTHGDKKSKDGIYSNQYKDTTKEGTYAFQFHAASKTFTQKKIRQKYVEVKPEPGYSRIDIQWDDISTDDPVQYLYNIELVPKDHYGNFMGPGHRVEVTVGYKFIEKINLPVQLQDRLDGTYTGTITISRSDFKTGAQLIFSIDGKPFTTVEKIPRLKKMSSGIYGGASIPGFSYSRTHDTGLNFGYHLGYQLSPQFSLRGLVGYNHVGSSSSLTDPEEKLWWNISANLKSEIGKSPFRVYINVGPGIYISNSGVTKPGFNFGVGAAYPLKGDWGMESGVDFHHIFTEGVPDPNFFVTYARLVYRF